ncbi:8122_t:CDS:2 [Funneliformis geosporum]|nr:8122_t:CDS:2 [Funneliformis geosporum]
MFILRYDYVKILIILWMITLPVLCRLGQKGSSRYICLFKVSKSGTFAALASVFAKLFTDSRTFVVVQYLCNTIGNETIFNCEGLLNEIKEDQNRIMKFIRICCFGSIFICNALMWTFFTKALNKSSSSLQVTVLNSATNFCMTAVLGNIIFGETLSLQWWFGASLIVIGTLLINKSIHDRKDRMKNKDKRQ